jgi:hypothetical protein
MEEPTDTSGNTNNDGQSETKPEGESQADKECEATENDQTQPNQEPSEIIEETKPNPDGFFYETNDSGACSVRVALRVRPLIAREIEGGKI